jgi:hypothetical protein
MCHDLVFKSTSDDLISIQYVDKCQLSHKLYHLKDKYLTFDDLHYNNLKVYDKR